MDIKVLSGDDNFMPAFLCTCYFLDTNSQFILKKKLLKTKMQYCEGASSASVFIQRRFVVVVHNLIALNLKCL